MEKKEKKTVTATKSEKLVALQIAQAMGGFDTMTTLDDEKYISALTKRAEMILRWVIDGINDPISPSLYFVRKDVEDIK